MHTSFKLAIRNGCIVTSISSIVYQLPTAGARTFPADTVSISTAIGEAQLSVERL